MPAVKPSSASSTTSEWPSEGLERPGRCPACSSPRREELYTDLTDVVDSTPGRWNLWRCLGCGTAYLDPRPTLATISRAYGRSYYTHEGFGYEEVSRIGGLVFATLPAGGPANRLVDVGSGSGAFVLAARRMGWDAEGVDPDAVAVEAARARGAPATVGTARSLQAGTYDVITMNHVVEHLHDPVGELRACCRALRPGGSVWIATPNIGSLAHTLFRSAWYGLEPPRHLAVFSQRGLGAVLDAAGFAHIEWRPSVSLMEAMVRVRRVLAFRRARARHERSRDRPAQPRRGAPPVSARRRLAYHHAVHAGLRAAELVAPRSADDLLVRAWAERPSVSS